MLENHKTKSRGALGFPVFSCTDDPYSLQSVVLEFEYSPWQLAQANSRILAFNVSTHVLDWFLLLTADSEGSNS